VPPPAVGFDAAMVGLASAGYPLMRTLALMGGRLPDRPTAVVLFAAATLAALAMAGLALVERSGAHRVALLLVAHAALALALSTGADPLMTVACTWLWLLLVPLAGVASVRAAAGSLPEAFTQVHLAMIPGSTDFVGLWLVSLRLNAPGLLFGVIPVGVGVALSATAALSRLKRPRSLRLDPPTVWAAGLLLIAAFPIVVM